MDVEVHMRVGVGRQRASLFGSASFEDGEADASSTNPSEGITRYDPIDWGDYLLRIRWETLIVYPDE